jgi:hypothetical protein
VNALDRFGEPIEEPAEDGPSEPLHDLRCRNGWIDRDADVPVPCLICRPHLAPDRLREKALGPYIPYEPPTEAS